MPSPPGGSKRKRRTTRKAPIPSRKELAAALIGPPRETAKELGIKTSPPEPSKPLPPEPHPWERSRAGKEPPPWMKKIAETIETAEKAETERLTAVREREDIKRGVGRPTKYAPWMAEEIVAFGKQGMEVVEFASELGVVVQTLHNWAKEHPEFLEAFTRAKEAAKAFHSRMIRGQLQLPAQATNAAAYLAMMGRRFPDWRDAVDLNVTAPVSAAVLAGRKRAIEAARAAAAEADAAEATP